MFTPILSLVPKTISINPLAYDVTITEELDTDYLKYLRRKIYPYQAPDSDAPRTPDTMRVDVSLDDDEGDIVAGVAAWTQDDTLVIDLIWVDTTLRGHGFGRKLIETTEQIAAERGCTAAIVTYAPSPAFYLKLGYSVTTQLVQFPNGQTFFRLHKTLEAGQPECHCDDDDNNDFGHKDEQPTCFAS